MEDIKEQIKIENKEDLWRIRKIMQQKISKHEMSFGNKLRKFFGSIPPKDDITTLKDDEGNQTTTIIKYSNNFTPSSIIVSISSPDNTTINTRYYTNDGKLYIEKKDNIEKKVPEHQMSLENKVRKIFGIPPKEEIRVVKDEKGTKTTTIVKYNRDFTLDSMTISVLEADGSSTKTKFESNGCYTERIFNSAGQIIYKNQRTEDGYTSTTKFEPGGVITEKSMQKGESKTVIKRQDDGSYISTVYNVRKNYSYIRVNTGHRLARETLMRYEEPAEPTLYTEEIQHLDKELKPITRAQKGNDSLVNGYIVPGDRGYDLAQRFLFADEKEKEEITAEAKAFSPECPGFIPKGIYKENGEDIKYVNGERYTGAEYLSYSESRRLKPGRRGSGASYPTSQVIYINGHRIGPVLINPRYVDDAQRSANDVECRRQGALLDEAMSAIRCKDKARLEKITQRALAERASLGFPEFQQTQPTSKLAAAFARGRENIASTKETTANESPSPEQKETPMTNISEAQVTKAIADKKAYE